MEVREAIADMQAMRQTHVDWAEYFEANPEEFEKRKEHFDPPEVHRDLVAQYDRVIRLLETIL